MSVRQVPVLSFFGAFFGNFIVRRFLLFLLTVWVAATLIFVLPRLTGQDPVKEKLLLEAQRGGKVQAGMNEMAKIYSARLGLDLPIYEQYVNYMYDIMRLDFGYSIAYFPRTVNEIIADSIIWSLGLMTVTLSLAFTLGTLAGALLGWSRSPRWLSYAFMPLLTLSAIPQYMLGLVLMFTFAILLNLLPIFGAYAPGTLPNWSFEFFGEVLRHAILPALSILFSAVGFWAIGMRGMMINTQGEDFMVQADAKGLNGARVFIRYAVRNALLPQVTGLAISFGTLLTGAVLVEVLFLYPGLGSALYQAVRISDFFQITGIVMTIIISLAFMTMIIDLVYPLIDPRVKYTQD
jgi:peptide/nickel transport system permease protein